MSVPCEFRVCPSGCVHMTFGHVTVHLGPQDFAAFVMNAAEIIGKLPPQLEQRCAAGAERVH